MRICIYSGAIPSTSFIERLVIGLSYTHNQVFVIGKRHRNVGYKFVTVRSYDGKIGLIAKILFNLIRLGFSQSLDIISESRKLSTSNTDFFRILFVYSEVILQNIDLFHVQWANDLDKWTPLKKFGVKIVVSLRGRLVNTAPKADPNLYLIQAKNLTFYDGIHAVCNNILLSTESFFNHEYKIKRTIYSGINLNNFNYNSSPSKSSIHLLTVGRSNWIKGLNYSIDAFYELQKSGITNLSYEIVGIESNDISEELIYNINDRGLSNLVVLTPHLQEDEIKLKMKSSQILIIPSVMEGIANVAIEAMALGLLVISSNVGGMPELINHGKNGWLFEARNSLELAQILIEVFKLRDEELNCVRKNARKTIEDKYTDSIMISNMIALYKDLLSEN